MPSYNQQEVADLVRNLKSNIFATRETIEQVVEDSSDTISVMIAVNTTLELVAQMLEEDAGLSATELRAKEAEEHGGGE
jgi:hypothetical protein